MHTKILNKGVNGFIVILTNRSVAASLHDFKRRKKKNKKKDKKWVRGEGGEKKNKEEKLWVNEAYLKPVRCRVGCLNEGAISTYYVCHNIFIRDGST